MAFIPEDDKDNQESGMNVLAGQDLQDQQEQQAQQPQQIVGGTPSTIQGGQPQTIGSQTAPPSSPKKQKGSGMFTNIRKYIKANQPSAQKMGGAITSGIEQKTGRIRSQLQQQQGDLANRIAKGRTNLGTQVGQGEGIISQAGQLGAGEELTAPQIEQFRRMVTQTPDSQMGEFNISAQKRAAQQLSNLAKGSLRSSSKANILKETFGRQQPYTRGQRSLDEMLLAGSPEASQVVTQTLRNQPKQAQEAIQSAQRDARQKSGQLVSEIQKAQSDLVAAVETGRKDLEGDIRDRLEALKGQQQRYQDILSGKEDVGYEEFTKMVSPEERAKIIQQAREAQQRIAGVGEIDRFAQLYGQGSWLTKSVLNEAERRKSEQEKIDLYNRLSTGQPTEVSGIMAATAAGQESNQVQSVTDPSTGKPYNVLKDNGKLLLLPEDYAGQEIITGNNGQKGYMTTAPHPSFPRNRITVFKPITQSLSGQASDNKFIRGEHAGMLRQELLRATSNISNQDLASLGLSRSELNNVLDAEINKQGGSGVDPLAAAKAIRDLAGGAQIGEEQVMKRFYDRFRGMADKGIDPALAERLGTSFAAKDLTFGNVATAEEASRLRALEQLMDREPTLAAGQAQGIAAPGAINMSEVRKALLEQMATGPRYNPSQWVNRGGL